LYELSDQVIVQGELAHRLVKRFYQRTNKKDVIRQIARQERRHVRLRRAKEATISPRRRHTHHVGFSENDPLPYSGVDLHHHMSDSKNFPHHLLNFVHHPPHDPAKKVSLPSLNCTAHFTAVVLRALYPN
jgi:hypothetical protein